MRICTKCRKKEPRNKTASYCKSCHNEYQKEHYKKNPQSIKTSIKRRRIKTREWIKQKKNSPCIDCGKKYPWYVMDFDHVKGSKKFNLSIAANKVYSIKKIEEEIKKCELVCANCHRIRTFNKKIN
jgi:hypothetical protein